VSWANAARRAGRSLEARLRGESGAPAEQQGPPDLTSPTSIFNWMRARGVDTRPQYLWPLALAAKTAKNLGLEGLTAVEFGVAGGNGLLALERAAEALEPLLGIRIAVVGFDAGSGMPEPKDHRDVPWAIAPGYFAMDADALRARLRRAELVLGPVSETVPAWLTAAHPPVGFAAFDLDYYSSTVDAFTLLDAGTDQLMPRIACYFDDLFGYGWSDFNGERAAIHDFNSGHAERKIGVIPGLKYELPPSEFQSPWPEQIYLVHLFDHPLYNVLEVELPRAWFDAHNLRQS
jgi:hypothetical protein